MSGRALVVGVTGISGGNLAAASARRRLAGRRTVPAPGGTRRADHAARCRSRGSPMRSRRPCAARLRRTSSSRRGRVAPPRPRTATSTAACSRTSSTRSPPKGPSGTSRSSPGSSTISDRSRRTPRPSRTPRSRRTQPRLPYENFYYVQEDILFAAAERDGFTWSVHRPHTLIGWALGNAMNMGVTLAVYGAICRETGRGVPLPGLARAVGGGHRRHRRRACSPTISSGPPRRRPPRTRRSTSSTATSSAGGGCGRGLPPRSASSRSPFDGEPAPLEQQMADAGEVWPEIVRRHGLRDLTVDSLASWWHTDADLGRTIETFTDMGRSRRLGFLGVRDTEIVVHRPLRAPAGRADRAVTPATVRAGREAGRPLRALRFHAARDLRIEDVAEPPAPGGGRGRRPSRRRAASAARTCTSTSPVRS